MKSRCNRRHQRPEAQEKSEQMLKLDSRSHKHNSEESWNEKPLLLSMPRASFDEDYSSVVAPIKVVGGNDSDKDPNRPHGIRTVQLAVIDGRSIQAMPTDRSRQLCSEE